jgi:hypothetical protein
MITKSTSPRARLIALLSVVPLALAFAPPASGADGESTPGVTVTAVNPGTSPAGSDLKITLTAHSEKSVVENPSCRPQDATLDCWGSLVLRIPKSGGLTVSGLEVHRVALGETGCGDEGGCDHEDLATTAAGATTEPVEAQVNGVGVLTRPGDTGAEPGTKVQLKIALTDNGTAPYADQIDVQINSFVPGSEKPPLYTATAQTVQQVQIHYLGGAG